MRILVVYATVEGQTRKIAGFIAEALARRGCEAQLCDAGAGATAPLAGFDGAIMAAPVHLAAFPTSVATWVAANLVRLKAMPAAFVSVSLASASKFEEEHAAIAEIADRFLAGLGWKPQLVHHAAGALRYTQYDFIKRFLMKHIAAKEGGSTDTSRDQEYTDWERLEAFVGELVDNMPPRA